MIGVELILKKTIIGVGFDWDTNIFGVLVAHQIAYKVTASHTPFQFFYGQDIKLPIKLRFALPMNCIK
jgi:hypothetical protein